MAEPLTITYQVSADELARAQVMHNPAVRLSAQRTKILGGICLAVGVVSIPLEPVLAVAGLCVGGLIFGLGTRLSLQRRNAWVLARAQSLLDLVTVVADERGVRTSTETSQSWFAWSHYEAVVEDDEGMALVLRGGATIRWIPIRVFGGRAAQTAWCHQLRAWMMAS